MSTNAYKIVLCGSAHVGKTTYITRLLTGEYIRCYVATLGVEVHPLIFHTSAGRIDFNVWDMAGNPLFTGEDLGEPYLREADGAIVMCAGEEGLSAARGWEQTAKKFTNHVVLVSNQCDRVSAPADFLPLSARSNYNVQEPFLRLARQLTNRPDLEFVNAPAVDAPLVWV